MLKDVVGCGGAGVRRAATPQELLSAFDSLAPAGEYNRAALLAGRSGCTDGPVRPWGAPLLDLGVHARSVADAVRSGDGASARQRARRRGDAPRRWCRKTGFHGLGGVDWIEDEDGTLLFLEFNARVTHVVGPARPAFGREIGAMLAGAPAQPHEVVLPPRLVPVFPAHFIRALKSNRAGLLQWLPLRASSADLDWRDGGVLGAELRDLVARRLAARQERRSRRMTAPVVARYRCGSGGCSRVAPVSWAENVVHNDPSSLSSTVICTSPWSMVICVACELPQRVPIIPGLTTS